MSGGFKQFGGENGFSIFGSDSGFVYNHGGISFDPNAQDIIDAMIPTPDEARQIIINTNVLLLKSLGIWTLSSAIYRTAAHSEQAGKLNWKNPGVNTLVDIGTLMFTVDRGFNADTDSALATGLIPSTMGNYEQDNACGWGYALDNLAQESVLFGVSDLVNFIRIIPLWSSPIAIFEFNTATQSVVASTGSNGLNVLKRITSTHQDYYRDGLLIDHALASSTTLISTQDIYLMGLNYNGAAIQSSSIRGATFGFGLGSIDQDSLKTTEESYLTAVGAI